MKVPKQQSHLVFSSKRVTYEELVRLRAENAYIES